MKDRETVRTAARFYTHRELTQAGIDIIAFERAAHHEQRGMRLVAVTWGSRVRVDPWMGCGVVELLFMEKGN